MKKIIIYSLLTIFLTFLFTCSVSDPTQSTLKDVTRNQLVLLKMVAIGNSLTAGVQSGGVLKDFQLHSYPYLIAQQIAQIGFNADLQQPLISSPGIGEVSAEGAYGPLKWENGEIVQGDPIPGGPAGIPALLENALLPRPYDNLGIPGANLNEILTQIDASGGDSFFDIVLRNPNFGNTTVIEQTKLLNPTLILLWLGNNDVLGAAINGGDLERLTDPQDFQNDLVTLLTQLAEIRNGQIGIIMGNIFDVTDIAYVNLLDNLVYKAISGLGTIPVVFDATFQPIDFDQTEGELYLPLLTEETSVKHLLLPFLSEYQTNGMGVPDSAAIVPFLVAGDIPLGQAKVMAQQLVAAMQAGGLVTSGTPISGDLTLTDSEESTIKATVVALNQVLSAVTQANQIPLIDFNNLLHQINTTGLYGYSGKFVFFDPANTAFSLDGIHPNNGGQAIFANEFIKVMNTFPDISIPELNPSDYKGQYGGSTTLGKISLQAAKQARAIFAKKKNL